MNVDHSSIAIDLKYYTKIILVISIFFLCFLTMKNCSVLKKKAKNIVKTMILAYKTILWPYKDTIQNVSIWAFILAILYFI